MKVQLLFLLALSIELLIASNPQIIHLDKDTRRFLDEYGRERIFHGTNVVFKGTPWIPITDQFDPYMSFSQKDMQYLKEWGLNTIRLGLMWPGAEPDAGTYNMTYLNAIKDIVDLAGSKYGIYSLLDLHQDILAARFCGEGAPEWSVRQEVDGIFNFPFPLKWAYPIDNSTGVPSKDSCSKLSWGLGQFSLSASIAYDSLYNNVDGVGDAFDAFWMKVADTFKDNPYVIGYEIINEPWAGNIYEEPWKLIPSIADRINLQPFHDRVANRMRQIDSEHLIFFESVTWDDFVPVGYSHAPGGTEQALKSVLSYHYYNPPNRDISNHFKTRALDTERLGTAGFLTQFDAVGGQALNILQAADEHLQSWQNWEYKHYIAITGYDDPFFKSDGSLQMDRVTLYSRTYAQAVAGRTKSMKFDNSTSEFNLEYEVLEDKIEVPTIVYFNKALRYPKGIDYEVSEGAAVTFEGDNYMHIVKKEKGTVTLKLTRK